MKQKGGFLVLRPDSGDPVETVLAGLRAAERAFGADVNKKGFKTPRGCSVLQGDGIDLEARRHSLPPAIDCPAERRPGCAPAPVRVRLQRGLCRARLQDAAEL